MKLILKRIKDNGRQTIGKATLCDENNKNIFEFVTLEPAWLNNAIGKSCIPTGRYSVKPRWSRKYGNHFIVENTEPRTYILFHVGNFRRSTRGCVLVGTRFVDIDGDGQVDVSSSRVTMNRLLKFAPNGFELEIIAPM